MLTFYITMSTIIVHVDFLLIFMGFPRFCPHYLCYVDKSWTNCHLWTYLSFFLFLTIPYFIRVCEVICHNSFCTFCHFRKNLIFLYYLYYLYLQYYLYLLYSGIRYHLYYLYLLYYLYYKYFLTWTNCGHCPHPFTAIILLYNNRINKYAIK